MKKFTLFIAIFSITIPALAGVYKWTDADGNVHYGDTPVSGAKKVDLPEPSVYTPVPIKPKPLTSPLNSAGKAAATKGEVAIKYKQLAITSPENDTSIRNNEGQVTVNISIFPDLHAAHSLKLLIDGKAEGGALMSTSLLLSDLDRGTHTLQAQVLDQNGKVLKKSAEVSFTVHRYSVLHNKPSRPIAK